MKKIILAAIAVLTFGWANAQEVKFGVKGSVSLSNFTGDDNGFDWKSKVGFNAGGFAEIKFSEKFAIQPEILYSLQGAKTKYEDGYASDIYTYDEKYNLSYINVPVMFKYYAAEKFNIEVGPQIGFLVSAKCKYEYLNESETEDVKDIFKSVDFGLNFGAGYDISKNISAGVRYNLGLSNIAKTEEGNDFKLHNSGFSLSVAYKF
ncbi:porin family protein [Flavobacterium hungaricum]|uniref:PorT family protein n=1 Tax=Flavobacterium hungaricum TaxID=2082725 RepID=A0ABR9TRR2_9FLAO|nr:porin family protein [Flavobacterium hungaricum]MBE8728011.1 PorT family protein [Flavobacterium hungaricum]